jgi:hypothetical protein
VTKELRGCTSFVKPSVVLVDDAPPLASMHEEACEGMSIIQWSLGCLKHTMCWGLSLMFSVAIWALAYNEQRLLAELRVCVEAAEKSAMQHSIMVAKLD